MYIALALLPPEPYYLRAVLPQSPIVAVLLHTVAQKPPIFRPKFTFTCSNGCFEVDWVPNLSLGGLWEVFLFDCIWGAIELSLVFTKNPQFCT